MAKKKKPKPNPSVAKATARRGKKKASKKRAKKKAARQPSLPGTQEPEIAELDEIASELATQASTIRSAKNRSGVLRGQMLGRMQKHDRMVYEGFGYRFERQPGDEKLTMKLLPGEDDVVLDAAE